MELKDMIKIRREELGLTLQDIADYVGVSKPTIQRYESGEIVNLKQGIIYKLSKILKTSPAKLMGWENPDEAVSSIINKKLEETGITLDQVATKAGVPLYWLQNIDTFIPGELGRENEIGYTWISQVAEVIGLSGGTLRAALALQEIPAYDGPTSSAEEDFEFIDSYAAKSQSPKLTQKETTLLSDFNKLNDIGQREASKRVEELSYIAKYMSDEFSETMNQFSYDFKEAKANKSIKPKFKNQEEIEKLIRETSSNASIKVIDKYGNELLIAAHNDNQSKEQQEKMIEDAKKIRHLITE